MKLPIVAYGDPVLKKVGEDIDANYPELKETIDNMFETMYWDEGPDPVQVGIATTESLVVGLGKKQESSISIFPNPTEDGHLTISSDDKIHTIRVYNTRGKLLNEFQIGQKQMEILLPQTSGTYLVEIVTTSETRIEKVLRK